MVNIACQLMTYAQSTPFMTGSIPNVRKTIAVLYRVPLRSQKLAKQLL